MITIEEQQRLLLSISKNLKKKIVVYAVGGTAMMFLGLKDITLDIDLVFKNEKDRSSFKEAAKSIGYSEKNAIEIYGEKKNRPEILSLKDVNIDLFLEDVIQFMFSDKMQERAKDIHQFGDNLIIKIADPHDIILLKCATDRTKDIDDARKIIENKEIKWDILIGEAKEQIKLGKEIAAFELGEFLEKLKNKLKVKIPKKVLDELYSIVEKQLKDKQKK